MIARAVHGAGDAGPASTTRDLADADALLPAGDELAARMSAALMELGQTVCTARSPRCADCPIRDDCAWRAAGKPPYAGPAKPVQSSPAPTGRCAAGCWTSCADTPTPVAKARLDVVWSDAGQRERCLDSLLTDGLRRADRGRAVRLTW